MDCPICRGVDPARQTCKDCQGRGKLTLHACPAKSVPADIWDTLPILEIADKHLPCPGGSLAQTTAFTSALSLFNSTKASFKV